MIRTFPDCLPPEGPRGPFGVREIPHGSADVYAIKQVRELNDGNGLWAGGIHRVSLRSGALDSTHMEWNLRLYG